MTTLVFNIKKENVEGKLMWVVHRLDGKKIQDDGLCSYNFMLSDFCCAWECLVMLESNANPSFIPTSELKASFEKV